MCCAVVVEGDGGGESEKTSEKEFRCESEGEEVRGVIACGCNSTLASWGEIGLLQDLLCKG